MAQIETKNLIKINQKTSIHRPVDTDYLAYSINGNQYFQIKTYALQKGRASDHESQSFQFSRNSAIDLIKLLQKELNISADELFE